MQGAIRDNRPTPVENGTSPVHRPEREKPGRTGRARKNPAARGHEKSPAQGRARIVGRDGARPERPGEGCQAAMAFTRAARRETFREALFL